MSSHPGPADFSIHEDFDISDSEESTQASSADSSPIQAGELTQMGFVSSTSGPFSLTFSKIEGGSGKMAAQDNDSTIGRGLTGLAKL